MTTAGGAENIFTLDGPTATGSGMLRAAATATARNTRGLSAGFDLQAQFEGAVDAKLTDAAKASFRASGSASVTAEAAACFPLDIFDFAGVVASLKVQAEARASVKLAVELQPLRLVEQLLAEHVDTGWRPYIEALSRQINARAGLQASAAVCVKAVSEVRAGVRLFPKNGEPAGTVFVVNFGYGYIYGYSWSLIAELTFFDPAALVKDVFQISARQLADVFELEGAKQPEPARSALLEGAKLVEMALPALADMLCTLLADLPGATKQARLTSAVTALGTRLGRHLLETLISAAMGELQRLLERLGLPLDTDVTNRLLALLHGIEDAIFADGSLLALLPDAVDTAVDAIVALALRGLNAADRQLVEDVAIGVWAGISLLFAEPTASRGPSAAMRRMLVEAGVALTGPGDLPARALGHSAARLLRRAGAAEWLSDITGLTLEQLVRIPRDGVTGDAQTFLREFLTAVGGALSKELLDQVPDDAFGLPPQAVQSVRTVLQVAVEELPALIDSVDQPKVLERLRERVGVGMLQAIGPPLVAYLEALAREGFQRAVPAVQQLADEAAHLGDHIPAFPRGGPLDRFTAALEDLGRESINVTLGLPTSTMLGHLASKLGRWRDERLPIELGLLRRTLCMEGETSDSLLSRLDSSDTSVVLASLGELAKHHLDQIRSITQFVLEDSADLLVRLTVLPFEQAARLFAASVKAAFELTAALIAEMARIAADLDARTRQLETDAAMLTARVAIQCGALAAEAAALTDHLVDLIITNLVGNDPVAREAAKIAFFLLTGDVTEVVSRALGDIAMVLQVAGQAIAAAARQGTLGSHGAKDLLESAVRATASENVGIPITILIPIVPPFIFATVTLMTVEVNAAWLGGILWNGLLGATGAGPIIAAIGDTATSLQATNAALDAVRAAGTPAEVRQRAADLQRRVDTAYRPDPITITFEAGSPQSVTTGTREAVVRGRVAGIDRTYVAPLKVEDGADGLVIPARVRFTCQGTPVPPEMVAWTDLGPRELEFSFRISVRPGESADPVVVVQPGVCVVSCLAAAGAWAGTSDEVGASKSVTFLLVPDRDQVYGQAAISAWPSAAGALGLAYATESGRVAWLARRDGHWSAEDAPVPAPRSGSGIAGWMSSDGDRLLYVAGSGGVRVAHRAADGSWGGSVVHGAPARIGRPQRTATASGGDRVAYIDEAGRLYVAVREATRWKVADVTALAGLPPAAPAADLTQWSSPYGFAADVIAEGNLLANPLFAAGPRSAGEPAAGWSLWAGGRTEQVLVTDLRPSTLGLPESARMIHVGTSVENVGLVQVFGAEHAGPAEVDAVAWVRVLRGEVGMGTGDGGSTGFDARTDVKDRWIRLSARNGVAPANEFIVYAAGRGGAEFLVAGASVRAVGAPLPETTWNLVFPSADGRLCLVAYLPVPGVWRFTDLMAGGRAPRWKDGGDLAGWLDAAGDPHVAYWADDGDHYELAGSAATSEWRARRFGPPGLGRRATRTAAATAVSGDERLVVCAAPDDSLHLLSSRGGAGPWTVTPLTSLAPATRAAVAITGTTVAMVGADRQIIVASRSAAGRWTTSDLSAEIAAPRAGRW
ncbi:hypothetical protein J5X84_28025 [Streptosporangiaceae bacterium NEAU-GS5]|nr:hypothetical protein [Streptosporangiaceae bacterium NEAU-GS5]